MNYKYHSYRYDSSDDEVEMVEKLQNKPEKVVPENVLLAVDMIKEEEIKNSFIGSKKDDIIIFDPVKAYENKTEVGHMLNISKEEAEELDAEFRFTVTEILQFEKAELNEELFKKLYGEETEVKTTEDFRARIKEEIATNLTYSSEHKFALDTRDALVEKNKIVKVT